MYKTMSYIIHGPSKSILSTHNLLCPSLKAVHSHLEVEQSLLGKLTSGTLAMTGQSEGSGMAQWTIVLHALSLTRRSAGAEKGDRGRGGRWLI